MLNEKHANSTLETHNHIKEVQKNISIILKDLLDRSLIHDDSKLISPELEIFGEHTPELSKVEYGSSEYKELLSKIKPAIDNHYSKNRHHPEHWPNGIEDMTLIDLCEMLCDWTAATKRNKNGNIRKSIEINSQKYNISPQLKKIFENTVREFLSKE